jgi:hypothetical protein
MAAGAAEVEMNRTFASALFLVGTLAGCSSSSGGAMLGGEEATALPPIKVDLPPPPSFADENQPREYPDGTVSIFGLRKAIDKYLGKEVKVKAFLLEVYQCPPCPKKQTCKLCDQPNFFISDKADGKKEKALMVVDYLMPKQKPPVMTVGKQYTIDGTFARNSPTGFASADGLLQFGKMVDDSGKEFLSPAAELEAKALAGEAAEAAQLQKAAATKAKALKK